MKIGIVCNLKSGVIKHTHTDDFEEEFDSPETMHAIGAVLASKIIKLYILLSLLTYQRHSLMIVLILSLTSLKGVRCCR